MELTLNELRALRQFAFSYTIRKKDFNPDVYICIKNFYSKIMNAIWKLQMTGKESDNIEITDMEKENIKIVFNCLKTSTDEVVICEDIDKL